MGRNDGHKFNYSKITEDIYIGSDLCKGGVCMIHGEEFRRMGITSEINLSDENNELPPKGLESYTWLPVVDGHSPSQRQLVMGTSLIKEVVDQGGKIYVHCKNGHGRSPTLVAAYFMKVKGQSLESAIATIKEKRPEIHIEDTQLKELKIFSEKWLK